MELKYNPLENNFTTYKSIEVPKVQIQLPLMESPLDISDWSSRVTESGTIIASPNLPTMTNNNPEDFHTNYQNEDSYQSEESSDNKELKNDTAGNSKKVIDFLSSKTDKNGNKLKRHVVAAIAGNLYHESGGFNPRIPGDNGSAIGLAQWRLDRRDNLNKLAKQRGTSETDIDTQLEFLWQELTGSYSNVLERMNNSKNVGEATRIFMEQYEKPKTSAANFSARLKYANSFLS